MNGTKIDLPHISLSITPFPSKDENCFVIYLEDYTIDCKKILNTFGIINHENGKTLSKSTQFRQLFFTGLKLKFRNVKLLLPQNNIINNDIYIESFSIKTIKEQNIAGNILNYEYKITLLIPSHQKSDEESSNHVVINGLLSHRNDLTYSINITIPQINRDFLDTYFDNKDLKKLLIPLPLKTSLSADLIVDKNFKFINGNLEINIKEIMANKNLYHNKSIPKIDVSPIKIELTNDLIVTGTSLVKINDLDIETSFIYDVQRKEGEISLHPKDSNMAVFTKIYQCWPTNLSPHLQSWLKSHIKSGYVNNAKILLSNNNKFNSILENIKLELNINDVILDGIRIKHKSKENSMRLKTDNAKLLIEKLETYISAPTLSVDEVELKNTAAKILLKNMTMDIEGEVESTLLDINTMLLRYLDLGEKTTSILNMTSGKLSGHIGFSLNLKDEYILPLDKIYLDGEIESFLINNNNQNDIINEIKSTKVHISMDNMILSLRGKSKINKVLDSKATVCNINLSNNHLDNNSSKWTAEILGTINPKELKIFSKEKIDLVPFIDGVANYKAKILSYGDKISYDFSIDLSKISINVIKQKNKIKNLGIDSKLNFRINADSLDKQLKVPYKLSSKILNSDGLFVWKEGNNNISITSKNSGLLVNGGISIEYQRTENKNSITVQADTIDISEIDLDFTKIQDITKNNKNSDNLIDIKINNIKAKDKKNLSEIEMNLSYINNKYKNGYFIAKFSDNFGKTWLFFDESFFSFVSTDIYYILNAFGYNPFLKKGFVEIKGKRNVNGDLEGYCFVKNSVLGSSKIVSRIMNIIALSSIYSGMQQLLHTSKLLISDAKCKLLYKNDSNMIYFTKCKFKGESIYLTGYGNLDLNRKELEFYGKLTPMHLITSTFMLAKRVFPILEKGIFAENDKGNNIMFKINKEGKTTFKFSPISMIIPAHIRSIFNSKIKKTRQE